MLLTALQLLEEINEDNITMYCFPKLNHLLKYNTYLKKTKIYNYKTK